MHRRSTRRFSIPLVALTVLFAALVAGPPWAQQPQAPTQPDSLGYYFLTSHYTGHDSLADSPREGDRFSFDSCFTVIHGPFRTKVRAQRAMRSQKRREKDLVYYTQIFKL